MTRETKRGVSRVAKWLEHPGKPPGPQGSPGPCIICIILSTSILDPSTMDHDTQHITQLHWDNIMKWCYPYFAYIPHRYICLRHIYTYQSLHHEMMQDISHFVIWMLLYKLYISTIYAWFHSTWFIYNKSNVYITRLQYTMFSMHALESNVTQNLMKTIYYNFVMQM